MKMTYQEFLEHKKFFETPVSDTELAELETFVAEYESMTRAEKDALNDEDARFWRDYNRWQAVEIINHHANSLFV